MLDSGLHRLILASLAAALLAAASPASASLPSLDDGTGSTVDDAREAVLSSLPATGTSLDGLAADVLDDDGISIEETRDDVGRHVPVTGTKVDRVTEAVLGDDGVVAMASAEVEKAEDAALATTSRLTTRVFALVPRDPLNFIARGVEPITSTLVTGPEASVADPEGPRPSAAISAVEYGGTPQLLVAGASAAAAAALVAFWVASSGSAGAAGAAGAASSSAGSELRRLLPFASPLFTRFEKDTVLGHPKREQLYALILQDPGVSLQSLCDQTGLSRTAVTHHLRLLELQHLIVSKRMGRSRHYYENGGRFGRDQKEAYAVLHNARSKDVARFVRDHPGAIQKAVCEALGIQPSIAHWHLSRLQQAQLVEAVRHGRTVSYFPGAGLRTLDQPVVPASALAAATPAPLPPPVPAPMLVRALPA